MKKILLFLSIITSSWIHAQLLPGTMNVSGMPAFIQNIDDVVREAGLDDTVTGFESAIDSNLISFTLDPLLLLNSEVMCNENVFRYSVYVHTQNLPANLQIEARTYMNSGARFPEVSIYDLLIIQPLGPRDLTPSNGGDYIPVPNDGSQAIKIFEFVGCRTDIPVQFRIKASSKFAGGTGNFNIVYTVVGSLL